eukprot:TRINITY_DN1061_c0_g1_i2.p1 TRINITY_DN1061_c0_g1~~TRINITY_DN1061_c0_g1_i2.p1  ORF type:complete len:250 (-),score=55.73 TRINITY_DN1061_c0_g1_i2:13-762(-)
MSDGRNNKRKNEEEEDSLSTKPQLGDLKKQKNTTTNRKNEQKEEEIPLEEQVNGMEVTDFEFSVSTSELLDGSWDDYDPDESTKKLLICLVIRPLSPKENSMFVKSDGTLLGPRVPFKLYPTIITYDDIKIYLTFKERASFRFNESIEYELKQILPSSEREKVFESGTLSIYPLKNSIFMTDPNDYPYLESRDEDFAVTDHDGCYIEPFTKYLIKVSENGSFHGRKILEWFKLANIEVPIPIYIKPEST